MGVLELARCKFQLVNLFLFTYSLWLSLKSVSIFVVSIQPSRVVVLLRFSRGSLVRDREKWKVIVSSSIDVIVSFLSVLTPIYAEAWTIFSLPYSSDYVS